MFANAPVLAKLRSCRSGSNAKESGQKSTPAVTYVWVAQGGLLQSLHPASLHFLTHPLLDLSRLLVAEPHDVRRNHRLSLSTVADNAQVTAVRALPASSPSLVQRASDSAALPPPSLLTHPSAHSDSPNGRYPCLSRYRSPSVTGVRVSEFADLLPSAVTFATRVRQRQEKALSRAQPCLTFTSGTAVNRIQAAR